jgi:DNA-binding transcriptional LysR family regulator
MIMDWDDLQYFLAVARHRTLVAAAEYLQVTQSTVGRRLVSLQARLNVRLFQKTVDGFILTDAGRNILPNVEYLEAHTIAIQRAVLDDDLRSEGLVRIASTPYLASFMLAPCFALLHDQYKDITIEAVPWHASEATQRDTDIMVQLQRFERQNQIVRRVGLLGFGMYASVGYLARAGLPRADLHFAGHRLITPLQDDDQLSHAAWLTEHAAAANVVLKVDSLETRHAAAVHGDGLAMLPCYTAEADARLRRIDVLRPIPPTEIWMGVREQVSQVKRVRIVMGVVADEFRAKASALNPTESDGEVAVRSARMD